jgi:hypothetical protein
MMENPVRTFDWRAQFDDAKLRGPTEPLQARGVRVRSYLLNAEDDPAKIELARELLRYAEESFWCGNSRRGI